MEWEKNHHKKSFIVERFDAKNTDQRDDWRRAVNLQQQIEFKLNIIFNISLLCSKQAKADRERTWRALQTTLTTFAVVFFPFTPRARPCYTHLKATKDSHSMYLWLWVFFYYLLIKHHCIIFFTAIRRLPNAFDDRESCCCCSSSVRTKTSVNWQKIYNKKDIIIFAASIYLLFSSSSENILFITYSAHTTEHTERALWREMSYISQSSQTSQASRGEERKL